MFVVCGPFMAIFTKVCSAKVSLPCMMLFFGIASACTAVAKNLGELIVCRVFIAILESGFLASVVFYLSTWYTRGEIASCIAIFYAGSVVASAFGGLLAYGVFHIKPQGNLFTWSYLFILEGSVTSLVAIIAYFVLPKDISHAYFLGPAEKAAAERRLELDSVQTSSHRFTFSRATSEFKTIHGWARVLIAFSVGILPNSSANFLAIMTQRLGLSVTKTNLYTVAPAMTAAVCLLIISFSSDHFRERGFHMLIPLVLSVLGYGILYGVDLDRQKGVAYMAIFFCTIGAYPMSVIFSAWTVANIPEPNARAFTTGVLLACLNSMGLVSSNIFFAREPPRYQTALVVNMAFPCVAIVLTAGYSLYLRAMNRSLDRKEHVPNMTDTSEGTTRFRFQT